MATRLLKEWLASHATHPYPSDEEKEALAEASGLTIPQISQWFVNARRRSNLGPADCTAAAACDPAQVSGASLPIPGAAQHAEWQDKTPFDRWRDSPPDQEAASLAAITRAINSYTSSAPSLGRGGFDIDAWPAEVVDSAPSSLGSFELAWSSQESSSSAVSQESGSVLTLHDLDRRRRRRRRSSRAVVARRGGRPRSPARTSSEKSARRIFQCTFCTDTFKTKHDWTRHEGALHLTLERWTCLPLGARICDPTEARSRCALCDAADPSEAHIDSHKARDCTAKALVSRTFHRKDHLRQHLRASHGIAEMVPSMEAWKSTVVRVNSRCGFCGQTFTFWSERNDHLADHFHDGARMQDWKGCRGLDAAVALLVENAMPPYLIGIEANSMEPFSASCLSTLDGGPSAAGMANPAAPTRFEDLTAQLGDYVRTSRQSDVVLTDHLLRRKARMIVYGDDDPWNQTPADNEEWLRLFKKGHGLLDLPEGAASSDDVTTSVACPQRPNLDSLSNINLAPFSVQKMQQASLLQPGLQAFPACSAAQAIPWSWQTPECLAEFSEMCEGTTPAGIVEAAYPSGYDPDLAAAFAPSSQMQF